MGGLHYDCYHHTGKSYQITVVVKPPDFTHHDQHVFHAVFNEST
uniref:Uncharacterized protein n=1 Tax=Arundo donax TaxID=35708 RepID=A0A0A9BDD0_ARUDO